MEKLSAMLPGAERDYNRPIQTLHGSMCIGEHGKQYEKAKRDIKNLYVATIACGHQITFLVSPQKGESLYCTRHQIWEQCQSVATEKFSR